MALFAIADTHLSLSTNKPMNIFSGWDDYVERLEGHWRELITDDEMQKIINKAHQLPYGDILVEFLDMFVKTFAAHTHPYPGLPPCQTMDYIETTSYDLKKILSDTVRIN